MRSRNTFIELYEHSDIDSREHREIVSDQFNSFVEVLKEDILYGNHSIYPDYSRIDKEIWDKCKILSEKGLIIGGSVILNLYGFINREIGDIDVWITDDISPDIKEYFKPKKKKGTDVWNDIFGDIDLTNLWWFDKISVEDNYENDRIKVDIENIGQVDIFNYKVNSYYYDGVRINSPFDAIEAKIGYCRKKDLNDFRYIAENIFFN